MLHRLPTGLTLVVAGLLACTAGVADTAAPPAEAHASDSEHLRDLMHRLDSTYYDRIKTELEAERERAFYLERLSAALAEMAGTTDALAETAPDLGLDESGRARFTALARELHSQVSVLREFADRHDFAGFRRAYGEVERTCQACHALFRDPYPEGGP